MKMRLYKIRWLLISSLLILLSVSAAKQGLFGKSEADSAISDLSNPQSVVATTDQNNTSLNSKMIGQSPSSLESTEVIPVNPKDMTEEQVCELVTGFWKSQYYGTRHLEIRDDGTATIYYRASILARFVIGKQVLIQYDWEFDPEKTQVTFIAKSGLPVNGYEYIVEKWGANQCQTVIKATPKLLLLLDLDGETEHHWRRIDNIDKKIIEEFEAL